MAGDDEEAPRRLSPAERAQQKREQKLSDLQEDIDTGRVTVRQMSDEEKAAFEASREKRRNARGR